MRLRRIAHAVAIAVIAILSHGATSADTGDRVALVIGNATYINAGVLTNPTNDAKSMAELLRKAGFDVIERENTTRRAMVEAIHAFSEKLSPGGIGLFYYSGHGIQAAGVNYILPIDVALANEDDLKYETIDVQDVLNKLNEAKVRLSLVILDACRNNPFARSFRSTTQGLAQMDAPRGTLIAFATSPGRVASDGGTGSYGLYTGALLEEMSKSGTKVIDAFENVIDRVDRASDGRQTPWITSSFRGDFYFFGGPAAVTTAPSEQAPKLTSEQQEQAAWAAVENSTTSLPYEAFVAQFPDGVFAGIARAKIAEIKNASEEREKQQQALVTPPKPTPAPVAPRIQDIDTAVIALRTAKVRAEPSAVAKELGTLAPETVVDATGRLGRDWVRIVWKNAPGYVMASLLQDIDRDEASSWAKVKDTKNPEEVDAFAKTYPNGFYARKASTLLAALRPPPAPIQRVPRSVMPPTPPTTEIASKIAGTYRLIATGGQHMAATNMTISATGAKTITAQGVGQQWTGDGEFDGTNGFYNWRFASGQSGRTEFSVSADGVLHGHVVGSGIDWWFMGVHYSSVISQQNDGLRVRP